MQISQQEAVGIVKSNMIQVIQALAWAGVREVDFSLVEADPMNWVVDWGSLTENEALMDELAAPVAMGPMLLSATKVNGERHFYALPNPTDIDKKAAIEISLENLAAIVSNSATKHALTRLSMKGEMSINTYPKITAQWAGDEPYETTILVFPEPEPERAPEPSL